MNTDAFYGIIRANLFRGKMTQGVVDTINAVVAKVTTTDSKLSEK